jgi:ribulose-phosphate 3-epimerase
MELMIAPSILAADLACLADEIARAEEGGCDAMHIDIMDGHFVPNLSYGPYVTETVRRLTNLPLDVHLMVDNPLDMIGPFADAGSDFLTVHVEVMDDVRRAFDAITARGIRPGVSLKPDTPVERILPLIADVDLVLVMSVYPGYGGQKFIEDSYGRIQAIADTAAGTNPDLILSVDGGVNFDNAPKLVSAGVNHLVAGTTVFRDHGARENVPKLREAALKGL